MNKESQPRISFGSQYKFPKKLMTVANDGILIKWSDDNSGIIVQEKEFERNVMQMYPGFVQVETFHNLRRLFRDYNFKFRILQRKRSSSGMVLEFRHQSFSRDNFDQLSHVKKRQRPRKLKYLYRYQRHPKPLAPSLIQCKRKTLKSITWKRETGSAHRHFHSKPTSRADKLPSLELSDSRKNSYIPHLSVALSDQKNCFNLHSTRTCKIYELFSGAEFNPIIKPKQRLSSTVIPPESHVIAKDFNSQNHYSVMDNNRHALLQVYAKNELNEEEFWELITRNSCLSCSGMSWEMIKEYIDRSVCQESSPLHFKGFYYDLPLSEM